MLAELKIQAVLLIAFLLSSFGHGRRQQYRHFYLQLNILCFSMANYLNYYEVES